MRLIVCGVPMLFGAWLGTIVIEALIEKSVNVLVFALMVLCLIIVSSLFGFSLGRQVGRLEQ